MDELNSIFPYVSLFKYLFALSIFYKKMKRLIKHMSQLILFHQIARRKDVKRAELKTKESRLVYEKFENTLPKRSKTK